MGEVPKSRPPFDAWLTGYLTQQPSCSVDTALKFYIKEHGLVIRDSLDEPPQITDVRTRIAILEESGLLDPANSRDEGLRRYADSLRSSLEMYSLMSPAARVELTKRAPVQAPARLPSRSCRYALTKKQKIVLAVGVGLIGLALLAAYPVEYQSAVKQRSPPATSVVFINTLAGALERAESPSGLTCIVILAISFYRYRIPRNAGTIDEGYELLENAVQLEGQGRVQDALTAYEDIARRYSHTEAGRDAQKSMESLKSKIG